VAGARLRSAPAVLLPGRSGEVIVELTAPPSAAATWVVTARPPDGGGLSLDAPTTLTVTLEPGTSGTAAFSVRADRPDAINGGRPWILQLRATSGEREETMTAAVAVPDPDLARRIDALEVRDDTTPRLVAWIVPDPCAADLDRRILRFPVRLLGRGIRVDETHTVDVTIDAPESLDASAVAGLSVLQGGRVLGAGTAGVVVTLDDRQTPLELEVELTSTGAAQAAARLTGPFLREPTEPRQADLFRLRPPRPGETAGTYRLSPDVVRLLMNALGGHAEPLGRRMHPLSGLGVGASLTVAFGLAGDPKPAEPAQTRAAALWIRWLASVDLELDLEARGRVESSGDGGHTVRVEVFDGTARRVNESEVVVTGLAAGAGEPAARLLARRRIERGAVSAPTEPSARGAIGRLKARLGGLWQRLGAGGPTAGRETPGT
jgi:hypothetical protein